MQSARSTLHVEVELAGSGLWFVTGDHLGVCADNDPAVVARVAARLGVNCDDVITVTEGTHKTRRKSQDGASSPSPPHLYAWLPLVGVSTHPAAAHQCTATS